MVVDDFVAWRVGHSAREPWPEIHGIKGCGRAALVSKCVSTSQGGESAVPAPANKSLQSRVSILYIIYTHTIDTQV